MWTGLVTGTLMFASPVLFDRLGWRGVAGATPIFMLWAGMPFFAGVVLYTLLPSSSATTVGPAMLKILVITGAIVQVSIVVTSHMQAGPYSSYNSRAVLSKHTHQAGMSVIHDQANLLLCCSL